MTMNWSNIRIYLFIAFVVIGLASIGFRYVTENTPVYLGIDFAGGTRIPIILEKPVDTDTMNEVVETLKKRASALALTEVKVRALGSDEVVVELPISNEDFVNQVEESLSSKGQFVGVVDGVIAIEGSEIRQGSIEDATGRDYTQKVDYGSWAVSFKLTNDGRQQFSKVVYGKAEYPIYMFLDRPSNAIILMPKSVIAQNYVGPDVSDNSLLESLRQGMILEGDDLPVYFLEDYYSLNLTPKDNSTKVILPDNSDPAIINDLKSRGFAVLTRELDEFVPSYINYEQFATVVGEWDVAGLMNAPALSPDLTYGSVSDTGYVINGNEKGSSVSESVELGQQKKQQIISILKGGEIPVKFTLGSRTIVPAPLGGQFLQLSVIGAAIAILAIALFVGLRYRHPLIVLGILLSSFGEVIILVAIVGAFSIDLGAMAGIIAAIGISVDSQVVITDEMLSKNGTTRERLDRAFQIVMTTGGIAVITMLPLIFSGLTEIIGFAISTMIGTLIGMFISRHAYAAYLIKVVLKED